MLCQVATTTDDSSSSLTTRRLDSLSFLAAIRGNDEAAVRRSRKFAATVRESFRIPPCVLALDRSRRRVSPATTREMRRPRQSDSEMTRAEKHY